MTAPTRTATIPANPPFAKGSIIWQKRGPLPFWAWALIGIALLFVVVWWRRNKTPVGDATTVGYTTPPNQQLNPIFVVPQPQAPPINVTVPTAPPGGGREEPPAHNPGSPFPPPPNKITVQTGTSSDDFINRMTSEYGLYYGQLANMYPGFVENIKGGGPTARFKATQTYTRVGGG